VGLSCPRYPTVSERRQGVGLSRVRLQGRKIAHSDYALDLTGAPLAPIIETQQNNGVGRHTKRECRAARSPLNPRDRIDASRNYPSFPAPNKAYQNGEK